MKYLLILLIGILAAWLFSVFINKGRSGLFGNMVLATAGSFVGMYLSAGVFNAFGSEGFIGFIIVIIGTVIGASVPLFLASSLTLPRFLRSERDTHPPKESGRPPTSNNPRAPTQHSRQGANNIFISYRRQDSPDVTGRIYDRLVNHFGQERIFRDVDSVPLGVDFRRYLDEKVGRCEILLAVIGNHWLAVRDGGTGRRIDDQGDFVRIEIESALRRGIPVIPILVNGATMPKEGDLPPALRELTYRNGLPIRPDPDFHKDVDRLIAGLEVHLNKNVPNT